MKFWPSNFMPGIARGYEWAHMTNALRRTAERRNKMVRWPISPTETSAQLTPFRLIAPLGEKLIVYLAKKLTFATPGPETRTLFGVSSDSAHWTPQPTTSDDIVKHRLI